ncbi:unnamed protein product [Pleuronectes platessa]|uniref:Uncharacterized protein n=1 Tax=Pleuronectes platessa TaxID=8262 RepID=A0A9N7UDC9_PLEPL|nr:unnamed protein product [Pleuronectes platessa]
MLTRDLLDSCSIKELLFFFKHSDGRHVIKPGRAGVQVKVTSRTGLSKKNLTTFWWGNFDRVVAQKKIKKLKRKFKSSRFTRAPKQRGHKELKLERKTSKNEQAGEGQRDSCSDEERDVGGEEEDGKQL